MQTLESHLATLAEAGEIERHLTEPETT
jgi:hypothetical protein